MSKIKYLLLFASFVQEIVAFHRCIESDIIKHGKIVMTESGPLIGKREIAIDPRQNKTVKWTSFYVSFPLIEQFKERIYFVSFRTFHMPNLLLVNYDFTVPFQRIHGIVSEMLLLLMTVFVLK